MLLLVCGFLGTKGGNSRNVTDELIGEIEVSCLFRKGTLGQDTYVLTTIIISFVFLGVHVH